MPQLDLFSKPQKDSAEQQQVLNQHQLLLNRKVQSEDQAEELSKSVVALAEEAFVTSAKPTEQDNVSEEEIQDEIVPVEILNENKADKKIINKAAERKQRLRAAKIPQKRGRKSFKEMDADVDLIEIPEDEELFKKQYYSISVVAEWFRVNTSLLRFWENEFDILKPKKNRKGDRLFRPEDVKSLQLIYHLLRQRKYSLEGAKEYLKSNKETADMQLQLTQSLQKFKYFLLELKANLHA